MTISEKVYEAKIAKYKKQYPDWEFKKLDNGWAVVINGEQRYIETISEEKAKFILDKTSIDVTDELYISAPNFQPGSEKVYHTFIDRPLDIITAIREGKADVMTQGSLFGSVTHDAHFFFNREVGEPLRALTMEGFKDAEFGYVIALHLNAGWGTTYRLDENNKTLSCWDYDKEPKYYSSPEEAQKVVDDLSTQIKEQVAALKTEEEYVKWLHTFTFDDICKSPVLTAIDAEMELKLNREPDDHRTIAHYFDIIQEIKRSK